MSNEIRITQLRENGTFTNKRMKEKIGVLWQGKSQALFLHLAQVFPIPKKRRTFNTWEALVNAAAPEPDGSTNLGALFVYQSPIAVPLTRFHKLKDVFSGMKREYQQALALAGAKAQNADSGLNQMFFIVATVVLSLMALTLIMIIVANMFGRNDPQQTASIIEGLVLWMGVA